VVTIYTARSKTRSPAFSTLCVLVCSLRVLQHTHFDLKQNSIIALSSRRNCVFCGVRIEYLYIIWCRWILAFKGSNREQQYTWFRIHTESKLLVGTHLSCQPSWLQSATMPRFWETCQWLLQGKWCWALRHYRSVFLLRILRHISYSLCTKDSHYSQQRVKLATEMIAVVLSRVAANMFSTMEHWPVIIDILCILRHFVVPTGKIKFSPLPRSVFLRLRYIRFSTISLMEVMFQYFLPTQPVIKSHQCAKHWHWYSTYSSGSSFAVR